MDLRATLNNSFTFLSIGAIFVGLTKAPQDKGPALWLFILFFIFLRLKMWLDDADYFKKEDGNTLKFKAGVVLAVISWSLWTMAGYSVPGGKPESYVYLLIMLGISTGWILVAGTTDAKPAPPEDAPRVKDRKALGWLAFNLLYAGGLALLLKPLCAGESYRLSLLGLLLLIAVVDLIFSKSFRHLSDVT